MSLQTVLPQWNQRSLTRTPASTRLQALCEALRGVVAVPATNNLVEWDPSQPYGRRVLHESDTLEAMIAGWTPNTPCAPHDHGGSIGAIRVLEGTARHTVWKIIDDQLKPVCTTLHHKDEVLPASAHLIHSMESVGERPLVTLHLYTDPIEQMVLYDLKGGRTLVVDGTCGAWLPREPSPKVRAAFAGVIAPTVARPDPT